MSRTRARFASQPPLVEVRGRDDVVVHSLDSNVRLTLEDVEANSPGLVVDGRLPDGQQFFVWTESLPPYSWP